MLTAIEEMSPRSVRRRWIECEKGDERSIALDTREFVVGVDPTALVCGKRTGTCRTGEARTLVCVVSFSVVFVDDVTTGTERLKRRVADGTRETFAVDSSEFVLLLLLLK